MPSKGNPPEITDADLDMIADKIETISKEITELFNTTGMPYQRKRDDAGPIRYELLKIIPLIRKIAQRR
jgi:hypothetical protein|tara:strand:+ start:2483 stop:2689 length:207 start_codon:yes stop_codon:yes gene_type:complete